MKKFISSLSWGGRILCIVLIVGVLTGAAWAIPKIFPQHVKKVEVKTKATSMPPLAYDKNSNAPMRALPVLNEAVDIQAPEIRGAIMGWNAFSPADYAVGGLTTSKGSLCEEAGLNIHLAVQNSCSEQGNQLYAFAQALHDGEPQPSKGVTFINWMGDGCPSYLAGLNDRITKDFGTEFRAEVVMFTGASYGEDKWLVKQKYAKDARGSLTCTVIRDGDHDIAMIKSQLMGWPINWDHSSYDRTKVNFIPAPNDDYVEAGKMYISGQKVSLHLIENGKLTGKDTSMACTGVASWFPVDAQVVQGKGGLVNLASTKDFGGQMGCAILMIKKWADDNRPLVEKMIEAFGKAGDQIKSHDEALKFACQVNELVFADKEKDADAWYNAYKSYDLTDDDGNVVNIGGSRSFNLADAAYYTGVAGGTDKYKSVYNTFGNIDIEAYPEVMSKFPPYEESTDWSFLRAVYNRNKQAGTEGNVSKTDFNQSSKGGIVGDANYSVEFNTGSAVIKPESYTVLNKIIDQLNIASNTFVEIAGHTDNTGNPEGNQSLSEARANSVKAYFEQKDADLATAGKMTSKGYGQTVPVADNTTAVGKARNRRVEIKLFKAKQ